MSQTSSGNVRTTPLVGPAAPTAAGQAAAERITAARRRRVWRSVVVFVLATAGMVVLSMANRDKESIRTCYRRMRAVQEQLQSRQDRGQLSPTYLPLPADASGAREHYYYNVLFASRTAHTDRVGVACCDQPHQLFLQADGRHLIVFDADQRKFELTWIEEAKLREAADDLGLRLQFR